MKIEKIYPLNLDVWQSVVEKAADATFFHTPVWGGIFSEYTQGEWIVDSRGFRLADGTVVVLPALKKEKVNNRPSVVYSMRPGVYGGLIAERTLTQKELLSLDQILMSTLNSEFYLVSNPLNNYRYSQEKLYRQTFTRLLSLSDGFSKIWRGFTKGHRSSYKKAVRSKVKVRLAHCQQDYLKYYEIYEDSLKRWGEAATSSYSWRLFEIIHKAGSPSVKLWLAELDNLLISGALVFYWNRHVVWWHGANRSSHMHYCGANLLQVEIIKDAIACGFEWYDFNPSGGHQGVENFKRSFGAKKKEVIIYQNPVMATCTY